MVKDRFGRVFRKDEYVTQDGKPDYKKYGSAYSDDYGFCTNHKENNDKYYIKHILTHGEIIIRYGPETGIYFAPAETKYEQLSLPYIESSVCLHKYKVVADNMEIYGLVDKGEVAPAFGEKGGGVQYRSLKLCALELIKNGILERV